MGEVRSAQHRIAAIAARIAWVLFLIGAVLLVVHFVRGRGPSPL
jgi:uncharacterized membrane protein YtjA (UPF0391 family)